MKPVVISYLRFSSDEQKHGDSQRRQLELSERWAKKNGLTITERLDDLGISAFTGANSKEGKLAGFLKLVETGKIPKGSILLVEQLDRISRMAIEDSISLFLDIIRAGITVVITSTGERFEKGKLDQMKFMLAVMKFSTANDESAKKSFRLGEAWKEKRQSAIESKKPLTSCLPAWLKIEGGKVGKNGTGKIVVNPAKAARDIPKSSGWPRQPQAASFVPSLKITPAITSGSNALPFSFRQ
jgi:DNA invertase Pin-like site-specific DNA recombinase